MQSTIPKPDNQTALRAGQAILREGHVMAAMQIFHAELGDIFRFHLPRLNFVMMVGPEANRMLLVSEYENVKWRTESDPITKLLGHGLLVEDGPIHDDSRKVMNPAVHRRSLEGYVETMVRRTDQIAATWPQSHTVDMLDEMRKVTILILMETLFSIDYEREMERLWEPIQAMLRYVSPGLWMFFPNMPRPGYQHQFKQVDESLYAIIRERRRWRHSFQLDDGGRDLLDLMLDADMSDSLIRDQILTMFIAGHDTSTAMLAWSLYFLATRPDVYEKARAEVDQVLGDALPAMSHMAELRYLDCVLNESLRLYPPAHIGSRVALTDLEFHGHALPKGTRMMYSIYLTHRDPKHWANPNEFIPERFETSDLADGRKRAYAPYAFVPFGGGQRNCIGAAFGQVEGKVILARILQKYELRYAGGKVKPKMAVTLEPKPGVQIKVTARS